MVGQTINGHLIEHDLGGGSYGIVYRVRNVVSGEPLALKIAKQTLDPDDSLRFEQENVILHQLKTHPRVLQPKSNIETFAPDITYYTMELADTDLGDYIAKNYTITLSERIEIFKSICDGLKHAHSRSVVHRDLHWGNVLVKLIPSLQIKLTDFGKAKDFSSKKIKSTQPCWGEFVKPPEVFFRVADMPTLEQYICGDMYALGILLYFLIAELPSVQIIDIRTRIGQYLRTIPDPSALNEGQRAAHYQAWLKTIPSAISHLRFQLQNQEQGDKLNFIMKRLCNVDYRERFRTIEELEQALNLLQL